MAARGARTQLSIGPLTPALDGIIVEDDTEMRLTARDGLGGPPRTEVDARGGRSVQIGGASTVSKKAVRTVAPALDRTVVEKGARRFEGRGQRHGGTPGTK